MLGSLHECINILLKTAIDNRLLPPKRLNYHFYLSGRSALYSLFRTLNDLHGCRTLISPDYVCNLVDKCGGAAGFSSIVHFRTNDLLGPERCDVLEKIEVLSPDVVVLAPFFGASQNEYSILMADIRRLSPDIVIVLDSAHSIGKLPLENVDAGILSFNRKTVNGLLGGVLFTDCTKIPRLSHMPDALSAAQEHFFFKSLSHMIIRGSESANRSLGECLDFEYSRGEVFPYDINSWEIPIASGILAILEMLRLDHYKYVRRRNYQAIRQGVSSIPGVSILPTKDVDDAAFIPVLVRNEGAARTLRQFAATNGLLLKPPYAVEGNPLVSTKPNLYAIFNPFSRIGVGLIPP